MWCCARSALQYGVFQKTTVLNFLDAAATWSSALTRAAVGFKAMSKYLLSPQFKKPDHLWSDSRPHENLGMPWLACVCLAQRPVARSGWRGKGARLSYPLVFPTRVLTAASCVCLRSFLSQRWLLCGWCLLAPGLWWSVRWPRHHC